MLTFQFSYTKRLKKYFANISSLALFGFIVLIWPGSHEFSAFFKIFCRLFNFLTQSILKSILQIFQVWLVWLHSSDMTWITQIFYIFQDFLQIFRRMSHTCHTPCHTISFGTCITHSLSLILVGWEQWGSLSKGLGPQNLQHRQYTVGQKTAPMFVHFGRIGMVWGNDISRKYDIITWHITTCWLHTNSRIM